MALPIRRVSRALRRAETGVVGNKSFEDGKKVLATNYEQPIKWMLARSSTSYKYTNVYHREDLTEASLPYLTDGDYVLRVHCDVSGWNEISQEIDMTKVDLMTWDMAMTGNPSYASTQVLIDDVVVKTYTIAVSETVATERELDTSAYAGTHKFAIRALKTSSAGASTAVWLDNFRAYKSVFKSDFKSAPAGLQEVGGTFAGQYTANGLSCPIDEAKGTATGYANAAASSYVGKYLLCELLEPIKTTNFLAIMYMSLNSSGGASTATRYVGGIGIQFEDAGGNNKMFCQYGDGQGSSINTNRVIRSLENTAQQIQNATTDGTWQDGTMHEMRYMVQEGTVDMLGDNVNLGTTQIWDLNVELTKVQIWRYGNPGSSYPQLAILLKSLKIYKEV